MEGELTRALLHELVSAWHAHNALDFHGTMRPPVMVLHDGGKLGWWRNQGRELSLQRQLAFEAPWGQVIEVLRHEMAHQYVHEVMQERAQTAHGVTFRKVCKARGIDARAAGLPESGDHPDDRVARRIRGLLALSKSSNEHEARAAMRRARVLLRQHNLEEQQDATTFTFQQVGPISGRFSPWEKVLSGVLLEHFCVSGIYARAYRASDGTWGRALELLGTPTNVEVAAYVHDVLRSTGEHLWRTYREREGLRGNAERRRYLLGVMLGFSESLRQQAESETTALVLDADPGLRAYMRQRYPHIRRARSRSTRVSQATAHGRQAGRTIQIHAGVREGRHQGGLITDGTG